MWGGVWGSVLVFFLFICFGRRVGGQVCLGLRTIALWVRFRVLGFRVHDNLHDHVRPLNRRPHQANMQRAINVKSGVV